MVLCSLFLLTIIFVTGLLLWKNRHILAKARILLIIWICFLIFVISPQLFSAISFIEWERKSCEPEYIGRIEEDDIQLDEYFVNGKGGFILTDSPPEGTCGWGDMPIELLPKETVSFLDEEFHLDCEHYSYLFTCGIQYPKIEYSAWSEGNSWYLGLKGYWRSYENATLCSCGAELQNDTTIYVFRLPKKYIALRNDLTLSGSISYFFVSIDW